MFKVIVVGESATGKTSLIKRYCHNQFSFVNKPTLGVDFALKTMQVNKNTTANLQLWDIAGQERFASLTRVYYRDAVAAMIVFDVTRPNTFEMVEKWKQDIEDKVFLPDMKPIPCILIANKNDLRSEISLTTEEIAEYCEKNGYVGFFETSAATNQNVDETFKFLVDHVLKNTEHLRKEQRESYDVLPLEKDVTPQSTTCCGGR